jgi:Icc-related predicted phosphoesterase
MRIAALGDLHCRRGQGVEVARRLDGVAADADLLALAGDLTDSGDPGEADELAHVLGALGLPIVAVLGNHDHQRDRVPDLVAALRAAGIVILDGESAVFGALGVAGTKGFAAGFGRRRLGAFGEPLLRTFVAEADREAAKLARALASLRTPRRLALVHYAPVHATLVGESPEIYPFLGDSDLGEAMDRAGVDLALHGHAHFGRLEGRTPGGVRVYNVASPLLNRLGLRWLRLDLPSRPGGGG